MLADSDYVQWLSELKQRYRQSQAKAAVHVNHGMLEFYWSLGKDIVALKAESKWGSNILQQLSADLKEAFPKQTGFSYTNIKYMRQWYSFYYEQITNRQQPVGEIENQNRQQPADEMVICKSTDKTVVEWSLKDICKPLGVATYQLEEVVERTVREIEAETQIQEQKQINNNLY